MRGNNRKNVVLVADDDLFVRKLIAVALQDFADVKFVTDGASFEEAYKATQPDIVYLDVHMPSITGLEIARKTMKQDAAAFMVMISADSCRDNVMLSSRIGARGFLTKPLEKERIMHFFNKCPTIQFMDF
jgi:DNA-binding NtrC family response regulator